MSQDFLFGLLVGLFAISLALNFVLVRVFLRVIRRLNATLDGAASYAASFLPDFRRDIIALIQRLDDGQHPSFDPKRPPVLNKARRAIGFRKEDIR